MVKMRKKSVYPELGKKKEEKVDGAVTFSFKRENVEGKTGEEIKKSAAKFGKYVMEQVFGLLMQKKAEWEKETEDMKKFLRSDN